MTEKRATFVCCYNKKDQFEELCESLFTQTELVDVIGIDNQLNSFTSCASAYNSVIQDLHSEFVIFSHQDIRFQAKDMVHKFINYVDTVNAFDIVGVAGGKRTCPFTMTNVLNKIEGEPAGGYRVHDIEECDVLDECFFGGHSVAFKERGFDEKLCNGWHLYSIERCLYGLRHGYKNYVCNVPLIHLSNGKIDHNYNITFLKLSKQYSQDIDYIRTPCAYASTKPIKREWAYIKREISIQLGRY